MSARRNPVVILDTNLLVSGLIGRPSLPRTLLERFRDGTFVLAISPVLLGELIEIATRPALRRLITRESLKTLIEDIREDAQLVRPRRRPRVVEADVDDDALFACALGAHADCILSGDRRVLAVGMFRGIHVFSPSAFFDWLATR